METGVKAAQRKERAGYKEERAKGTQHFQIIKGEYSSTFHLREEKKKVIEPRDCGMPQAGEGSGLSDTVIPFPQARVLNLLSCGQNHRPEKHLQAA